MADSASEMESDTSSIDGGPVNKATSPAHVEQMKKRVDSLEQENRVLKMELDTCKQRCKSLLEENRDLRRASVSLQAKAEQEEEFISNKLFKKIQVLQKEKEALAMNYEQEEEFLTNDLTRKLCQLRQEKVELEETLEKEQEYQVKKLMKKIEKLEAETVAKQENLERLRREKIELENALEQEQEALVNRLWKRMDKLETEKRTLQEKLDQPVTTPPASPREKEVANGETAVKLSQHIQQLRSEVQQLRLQLRQTQSEHEKRMHQYQQEERHIREENLRLQRKLQLEMDRREQLCRHLSESESSLEMEDERHYNEMSKSLTRPDAMLPQSSQTGMATAPLTIRTRTVSSPIPVVSPGGSTRPISPAHPYGSPAAAFSPPSPMRIGCAASMPFTLGSGFHMGSSPPVVSHVTAARWSLDSDTSASLRTRSVAETFAKPSHPVQRSPSTEKSPGSTH